MSTSPSIKRYRLLAPQTQIVGLVIFWALTIAAICVSDWRHEPLSTAGGVLAPRVVSVVTGCLAVAFLFFPETQIVVERGAVVDVVRFLGIWTVRQRQRSIEEFAGVKYYCSRTEDSETAAEWTVELCPKLGPPLSVRQFFGPRGSADCPEARAFARELSELTGLEVVDDDV